MKLRHLGIFGLVGALSAFAAPVWAQTAFSADLEGAQEVPPVATAASGTATLTLNAAGDALTYTIVIDGLDMGPLAGVPDQTADPNDDVVGLHIHNAAPGVNGPIVFGMANPGHDPDDIVILANGSPGGTVSGIWEETDPANSPLSVETANLFAGTLYVNAHTVANPGGEIRGQISESINSLAIPTLGAVGTGLLVLLLVVAGAVLLRRRFVTDTPG